MPLPALIQQATAAQGPPAQDPGLTGWATAGAFLVLAALAWAVWRKLAE